MTETPDWGDDDFKPATMKDNEIYVGTRRYVSADLLDDAVKALETAIHDEAWNAEMESRSEGSWMGQARATLAKLRSKP